MSRPAAEAVPAGYEACAYPGAEAVFWHGARSWMDAVLGSGLRLHEWAGDRPGAKNLRGRGPAYAIDAPAPGPEAGGRWVVRHFTRGGRVAPLLGDRYLAVGRPRPLLELSASAVARDRGVPTPAVVAGAVYPSGPFYRADLVTEAVPGARTLGALVFTGNRDTRSLLTLAGRLVGRLESSGVRHADLNASNIVITSEGGPPLAHVLDLDRCRILPAGRRADTAMRRRLERSLRKHERAHGRVLSGPEWSALRAGYEASE